MYFQKSRHVIYNLCIPLLKVNIINEDSHVMKHFLKLFLDGYTVLSSAITL